ncbi:MAG: phosphodiester glycosidase family protein [Bacteroidales bacterium]|nr:phosphodiester glycosidase family protein [Bacteroidales bacterium]
MNKFMTVHDLLKTLKNEKINTWFDLGLFIDRFKEHRPLPPVQFNGTYAEFKKEISKGGVAFITFHYAVDGVTVEIGKYAKIFANNFKNVPIHYISGIIHHEADELIYPTAKKYVIKEIHGFDDWDLYKDFFFVKLERGSKEYNDLIYKFWNQVLVIVKKLGNYLEKHDIKILYLINTNSNPGNVALALAVVILSEFLGIPVINNSHDYYWEGGNRKMDKKIKNLKKGPRDFFFTNADVGEFFSQIEALFPWESRSWINVNINQEQNQHIIVKNGHNPANVAEVGTAVDTGVYFNISKRRKINAFHQFEKVLSRYRQALVSYSVNDALTNKLVDTHNPKPILIGTKTRAIQNFLSENVIFLQPTRIISRKRIELGFKLVSKIFEDRDFIAKLKNTTNLKLTIIITGPIAAGHHEYFEQLLRDFAALQNEISPELKNRLFLAFLFSELDKEEFKKRFKEPVGIPELYNIASLVLLPSKTEGRGLPIIEATACGTPIFCRRYTPEKVYSEVIGENLPEIDRLKVIEFNGKKITDKHVQQIIRRVFYPHLYTEEILHNRRAVQKRFSLQALDDNLCDICYQLYLQLKPNAKILKITEKALEEYKVMVNTKNQYLDELIDHKNRHYMPGYGRLSFMLYLKSLIDPSFFRVEQQEVRGMVFEHAMRIIKSISSEKPIPFEKIIDFYNAVDTIFHIKKGNTSIRHDHSMSYRHRNTYYYPYQDFTFHELTGLISLLYIRIINIEVRNKVDDSPHFFTDWDLALSQLTTSPFLSIDNRKELIKKLQTNIPVVIFPGEYIKQELEFFALQSVRSRLNLKLEEELTERILKNKSKKLAPVYIFVQEHTLGRRLSSIDLRDYILGGKEREMKLLYKYRILRIVAIKQLSVGIHFAQIGEEAQKILCKVRSQNGFIISNRTNAAVMTDIVDIDRFHIGCATHPLTARILGIPEKSGYIQYVPAGLRTTLAYPTPIQTAKDFDRALHSKLYKDLCARIGEDKLRNIIREDAREKGTPLMQLLEELAEKKKKSIVQSSFVSGIYADDMPWSGAMARVNTRDDNWQFMIVSANDKPQTVIDFTKEFGLKTKKKARIAWNGGYILNAELVGKLGLPETYIGSPLGLIISNGKLICPPLFNRSGLLIYKDGRIDIRRVTCSGGFRIKVKNTFIQCTPENYNNPGPGIEPCYYDLLYPEEKIPGNGRIIVRLAGNVIKEIIHSTKGQSVKIIPVGIMLSFHKDRFPDELLQIGQELDIIMNGFEEVKHAVGAGPMLLEEGEEAIDMEAGGWKTLNSIRTQAARLDYTDMRGPKIAVGIDENGILCVLTINGRIRESVGATHYDMAEIMKKFGMIKAMGFDPGGSSTLVVDGKTLNISPYNRDYETDIYSLPPQPRAVSNAVIGYIE